MERGTSTDFTSAVRQYQSSNDYDAVDASNRLGAFALDEVSLRYIGMVKSDADPLDNDYSGGWTGMHGITSKDEFLASPGAQDMAFRDILHAKAQILRDLLFHYDGQTINGQPISLGGMLGAACLTDPYSVERYVTSGVDLYAGKSGQLSVSESLARFHGYDVPYRVEQRRNYHFQGSDGPDIIRGYNGRDVFWAKGGDDQFDGGAGEDCIVLEHKLTDYSVTQGRAPATWHIKRQPGDGRTEHKEIKNVELLQFEDGQIVDLRELTPDLLSVLPQISVVTNRIIRSASGQVQETEEILPDSDAAIDKQLGEMIDLRGSEAAMPETAPRESLEADRTFHRAPAPMPVSQNPPAANPNLQDLRVAPVGTPEDQPQGDVLSI
ncbi:MULTISPECIES: hypothetical protein [unclassified Chelatococcus]|uniref:hypothetical protein n=1 Tax=unclassified Chelatococcus TaxID=2638111 RepID=UPI001BCAB72F|nr:MULTISPECIES: hypothetical protein [unclassified Chelatococcus]MBS7700082.1 hypothetical protein [Chelatococcus sp. YT9]MBX3556775.1 hypothetical protein [Chelatococcus sp.]